MSAKTYIPRGERPVPSQMGATLEALASVIAERHRAADAGSYTYRLLSGGIDEVLKKVMEEAGEVALAAKDAQAAASAVSAHEGASSMPDGMKGSLAASADAACDHLRYEAADVVYHLLVVLERFGIDLDEFAAELNSRMTESERPCGGALIVPDHVKRGK
ncbi:MAG: phosphoribosyl-ATP diphosphatase [Berryella intestinalis]|uniref:phosphoribosyl-ATP diphosphatase n=1 Tax=Berryella intestinalis TaxID=1531429 RepID=UPI002A75EF8A|nr:phosphoribosyl-ATP diphosphatase [Berryella intestinalis]MDY3129682.1 phosphoribosyl-ATP diphosphatase [Berryella intestinalis]